MVERGVDKETIKEIQSEVAGRIKEMEDLAQDRTLKIPYPRLPPRRATPWPV